MDKNENGQSCDSDLCEIVNGTEGEALDSYLISMVDHGHFMGSVLVQKEEDILLCKGYGFSYEKITNRSSTIYQIASLTKQFTAAAILLLQEEKKVRLDVSINEYLPEQFRCAKWKEVNIHHLLSHTSGIWDYTNCDDYWSVCKNLSPDVVIEQAKHHYLEFTPGGNYAYCNTGYDLLGKIIEVQSGISYREFIKQKLLIPAEMLSSGQGKAIDEGYTNCAVGHYVENLKLTIDPRDEFSVLFADGGMYSTVLDLAKWRKVLTEKTDVLSKSVVDSIIEKGYGLMNDKFVGHRRIHHNGTMAGFWADFCIYPDDNLFIVILGNNVDFVVDYLTSNISTYLLMHRPLNEAVSFSKDFNFSPYLSTFLSHDKEYYGEEYTFERRKDQLILQNDSPIECVRLANDHLFIPSEGTEYRLQKNGSLNVYNSDGDKIDLLTT